MREVKIDDFVNFLYIKELNKKISESVKDGILSDGAITKLAENKEELFWLYGFTYSDVSGFDLSKISYEVFNKIAFSTYTKFPTKNKLPKYFNPTKTITEAMRSCYRFNVEDKGCSIAIIDNPTQFYKHEQFKNLN